MGWWIYLIITITIALLLVPVNKWRRLSIIGFIGMLTILPIDHALISLGAFKFNFTGLSVLGLPLPYWIGYFPGGILFAYFRPTIRIKRLLYILFSAAAFAFVELITIKLGLFIHLNWSIFNAFILNIYGFTTVTWFIEWLFPTRNDV